MSDPDRLAAIKRRIQGSGPGIVQLSPYVAVSDDIDWLIGEVERLEKELDDTLLAWQHESAQIVKHSSADKREIARLRALLEPSVTMTSPHVVDPGNDEDPPPPK